MPLTIKGVVVSSFSGALLALSFPRPGLCFLGWFALAPLFASWREACSGPLGGSGEPPARPLFRAFLLGLVAGFAYHGVAFYWAYSTCRFAGVAVPVAALAWAGLALFQALHWGLVGAAGAWSVEILPRPWRPWAWALVWTALSVAWERWTPRLIGDFLAYTQYRHLSLLQSCAVFGSHGLGFLVAAANACLRDAWEEARSLDSARQRPLPAAGGSSGLPPRPGAQGPSWAALNLALVLALVGGAWAYGAWQLTLRSLRPEGTLARVELLQPNIDQYQKWDAASQRLIMENFDELLSRPRPAPPRLIVWPESAIPWRVDEEGDMAEAARWSQRLGAFQMIGAVSSSGGLQHNSVFLVGPEGRVQGSYHKRRLVPFGEFIPFEAFLRGFVGILNQLGGIAAGEARQPLMDTPLGPAAASICYEAVFPRWARLDAERGARLIVNVTNDGWYKDTAGPRQHFTANIFRAIENRVTVLRSGNTGISGAIDPWGVVTAKLGLNERGRLDVLVPLEDPFPRRSFYARHGDWFGSLCLALALVLAAAAALPKIVK